MSTWHRCRCVAISVGVPVVVLLGAGPARANGVYTHVHISQLAQAALPAGPVRDLLSDPEVMLECERGSMFPDSGYAAGDAYGEFAHWEPFFEAFLRFLRDKYGGDFSSPDAAREAAFLLGAMSHGIADQVYDTTILAREFEVDGPEPPNVSVDQFADYFLPIDHGVVVKTTAGGPYADLAAVLNEEMGRTDVTEGLLDEAMETTEIAINAQGGIMARAGYLSAWQYFPWLGTHIYNEKALGSIPDLGKLVARSWQVIWKRLLDIDDPDEDMVVRTIPEDGGVNFPVNDDESVAYSRIGVVFGYGVKASETFPRIKLRDADGVEVEVEFGSPYGGEDRSFLFFKPTSDLAWNSSYTVEIAAGVAALGGETTTQPYTFSFRTRCADDKLSDCPPLEPPLVTGDIPTALPEPQPDGGVDEQDASDGPGASPGSDADDDGCSCRTGPRGTGAPAGALAIAALGGLLAVKRRRGA